MKYRRVAIVIATYNREEVLLNTIVCTLRLDYPKDTYTILVVDQTKEHTKEVADRLAEYESQKQITWKRPPEITFAATTKARNVGIAWAKNWGAELITFIDDDVTFEPNFLREHVKEFENDNVGATAGRILVPSHTYPITNPKKISGVGLFGSFTNNYYGTERWDDGMGFVGCNCTIRLSVFEKCGLFDENFIGSAMREETDVSLRIHRAGYTIPFVPSALVYHHMKTTGGSRSEARRLWYFSFFHGTFLFFGKHFSYLRMPLFILGLARPILVCWLYYGRGSLSWALTPWRGIISGLSASRKSKREKVATLKP